MNRFTLGKMMLATCITAAAALQCQAQGPHTSQLLSGGDSCLHVIRLIHIHGVNQSVDLSSMRFATHHSPLGGFAIPGSELGDLEILHVHQAAGTDPACGPQFNVAIRNNSCRDVGNFYVTLVATLGRIHPGSPNVTTSVESIPAGGTTELCIRLPVEALAMGNHNGQIVGFQTLVVAIDAFDELTETDEANNLKALAASEIPFVAIVQETAAVVTETTTSVETTAPGLPAVQRMESSSSFSDVTFSDEEVDVNAPLRSAIRMLGAPTQPANPLATNVQPNLQQVVDPQASPGLAVPTAPTPSQVEQTQVEQTQVEQPQLEQQQFEQPVAQGPSAEGATQLEPAQQ